MYPLNSNFRTRAHWGGNTPCVQVETGSDDYLILDGGSGLRVLGKELMAQKVSNATFHIFLSHFHYDHIQGIPFFAPAYSSSNRIVFHGGHKGVEKVLREQMREPYFPINFDTFGAQISFEEHNPGDVVEVCDSKVTPLSRITQVRPMAIESKVTLLRWFIPLIASIPMQHT